MVDAPKRSSLARLFVVVAGGMLALSFLGSIIGGFLGIVAIDHRLPFYGDQGRRVVLEENSAIIDVVNKVSPSVVSIASEELQENLFGIPQATRSAGTGIIVSHDGLILTNRHVIPENASTVMVVTAAGEELVAKIVDRDPQQDIAYLRVDKNDLPVAELGDSSQVVVGQRTIAIGNALGEYPQTVTSGIISGIGRPVATQGGSDIDRMQGLLQTDAAINPGNSGGPLVNIDGQVIGINTAVAGGAENIGFAIPINQTKAGILSIERYKELRKPYLGVSYINLTKEIAAQLKVKVEEGAYVFTNQTNLDAVMPGSPAAEAGIKTGDVIVEIDDKPISKQHSLQLLIGQYQVGDKVQIKVFRGNETLRLDVTFEELPTSRP